MVIPRTPASPGMSRRWSLRREWSRAFTILTVLLLLGSTGTFLGVRHIVGEFSATAARLAQDTTEIAALGVVLNHDQNDAHEVVDGTLLHGSAAFSASQGAVFAEFAAAQRLFPSGKAATLLSASAGAWRSAITATGIYGARAKTFTVPLSATARYSHLQLQLAAGAAVAQGILSSLERFSLAGVRASLADEDQLERLLLGALAGQLGLAMAITVYFRRRLSRDLLRPVATMYEGVVRLESGQYDHAIRVARRDELGELAEAFNSMTGALHTSREALRFRASHDVLTGLPNRASLTERLAASFGTGADLPARQESLLFIDIDDFKDVNDALGHEGGDVLLVEFAARLESCLRSGDLPARLGGDEFAAVVVEDEASSNGATVAARIVEAMQAPFVIGHVTLPVTVSIGVTRREAETADAAELLRQADFAMYMAKGSGKGRYEVFDALVHDRMVGRAALRTAPTTRGSRSRPRR